MGLTIVTTDSPQAVKVEAKKKKKGLKSLWTRILEAKQQAYDNARRQRMISDALRKE